MVAVRCGRFHAGFHIASHGIVPALEHIALGFALAVVNHCHFAPRGAFCVVDIGNDFLLSRIAIVSVESARVVIARHVAHAVVELRQAAAGRAAEGAERKLDVGLRNEIECELG